MSTKALEKMVRELSLEVARLRSFVIGTKLEKDPEGDYKPEFVKEIKKIARSKKTLIKYTTPADFLKRIKKA